MRINTNINSMRTQEYMRQNQAKMSNAMDRLSSGKRINNASDDAAGLAIATRMRARESGLGVAADNTQNGMSLIRTADSALNSVSNILLRMRDIANQSANGTNTDKNQVALQKEFGELQKQITYIADNTQFNDKNLLKNDQTINIQTLDSSDQSKQIGISLKGITLDKLGIDSTAIGADNSAAVNLKEAKTAMAKLATSDEDSVKEDVAAAKVAFEKVKDQFSVNDARAIEDKFIAFSNATTDLTTKAGEINSEFGLKKTTTATNLEDAASKINGLKTANGDDLTALESQVGAAKTAFDKVKDFYSKEDSQKINDLFAKFDKTNKTTGETTAKAIQNAFKDMDIVSTTKADALAAVDKIDEALKMVADNRATLGATLNRLDFNVNNLKSQQSAMASSASQVEDADMAKEMSEMTKFKILNEAGISMLSQANQTPQMVSKLLQ
ncbi:MULTISPECIES: flagellin N-terminal helical domain-containing protein [Bacillus]|uniref:flagellin N-terminal helical domain-containing protein n=1 Tax=Bacillus TaxID=1386 RepID=UPI00077A8853|nr:MULTISPECIES: flagellin [Bacillus cereus group]KXY71584.1 flagellin [Bacillus cereus]MBG9935280.1 flagellin [Bacillus tropicus]MED2995649.1 flagellin [Bacillus tropicus]OTY61770.1 flagellin [Bacillus thuringiensis serovar graciosensis]